MEESSKLIRHSPLLRIVKGHNIKTKKRDQGVIGISVVCSLYINLHPQAAKMEQSQTLYKGLKGSSLSCGQMWVTI